VNAAEALKSRKRESAELDRAYSRIGTFANGGRPVSAGALEARSGARAKVRSDASRTHCWPLCGGEMHAQVHALASSLVIGTMEERSARRIAEDSPRIAVR
jgi:hypothetical protein